jgi:unsaturated rhamnogalacturonyl hydrolase
MAWSSALSQQTNWGEKFSNAIMDRYQPTIDAMTHHGWDHSNSIILHGMEKIYAHTNNPKYFNYIKSFVDSFVDGKGNVTGLRPALDGMHPGLLCLFMYEKTGEAKYKTAATIMRNYLIGTPSNPSPFNKTPEGGYWHSQSDGNKNVMSVDGIYMAHPFLVKYGKMFNDTECFDIATFQLLLVAEKSFNITTKLPYHGWDHTKSKPWANPITGTSTQHWSRSTGWFSMALVDILESLPLSHKNYKNILFLFQQLAEGIKENQHPTLGYWYHVLNKQEVSGNYPESSTTGMVTYSIMKGVNLGLLDKSYEEVAIKGWKGLQGFIKVYSDGKPQITSFTPGMGYKNDLADYLTVVPVSCPTTTGTQHPHGYCAVLMASSVMEK